MLVIRGKYNTRPSCWFKHRLELSYLWYLFGRYLGGSLLVSSDFVVYKSMKQTWILLSNLWRIEEEHCMSFYHPILLVPKWCYTFCWREKDLSSLTCWFNWCKTWWDFLSEFLFCYGYYRMRSRGEHDETGFHRTCYVFQIPRLS